MYIKAEFSYKVNRAMVYDHIAIHYSYRLAKGKNGNIFTHILSLSENNFLSLQTILIYV